VGILILVGGLFFLINARKEKIYDIGEEVPIKGRVIKVVSVEKDWQTSLDVDKPREGKKYVVAKVTIENATKETIKYSETNDFDMEDANGNIVDFPALGGYGLDRLGEGSLRPGAKVTKDIIFELDADAIDEVYLVYYPNYTKNKKEYIRIRLQSEESED